MLSFEADTGTGTNASEITTHHHTRQWVLGAYSSNQDFCWHSLYLFALMCASDRCEHACFTNTLIIAVVQVQRRPLAWQQLKAGKQPLSLPC